MRDSVITEIRRPAYRPDPEPVVIDWLNVAVWIGFPLLFWGGTAALFIRWACDAAFWHLH